MVSRFLLTLVLLLTLAVSASSQNLHPLADARLRKAAERLKAKDYRGALTEARAAADSPEKSMVAGAAALRLEEWAEAAELLGRAAKEMPLLADYALLWQAEALKATARHDEALDTVKRLLQGWPDSPMIRRARMLQADTLFACGRFREALDAYVRFVESYPSGNDSIAALHQSALCREGLGEEARAVKDLRNLWLTYPGSSLAEKAEESLRRLGGKGFAADPWTPEELFRRGNTLYSLGRYEQAVKTFDSIPLKELSGDFTVRISLKTGQSLYKLRRYRDATRTFSGLIESLPKPSVADEARFWHARAMEKSGREEEAFAAYLSISEKSPASELAADALLEAAFIRKFQGRYPEELALLDRLIASPGEGKLKQRATWEAAWARYNTKDYRGAAEGFKALLPASDYRERALYWHGRALEAAADREGAARSFALLLEESPLGFYAVQLRNGSGAKESLPCPPSDICSTLPVPAGNERAKALIALGLHDEARRELNAMKKNGNGKKKPFLGIARLYLEMGDYASAAALVRSDIPKTIDAESLPRWGLLYPRAFSETVSGLAGKHDVPEELVYSLIKAESGFAPGAVSPVGAIGLMQLMPSTARALVNGHGKNAIGARLAEPEFNIGLGIRHLRDLLKQYNGNVVSAVAAYNAGSSPVDRWRRNPAFTREDEFIENIPYHETREYVKKVLAGADLYRRLYRLRDISAPLPGKPTQSLQPSLNPASPADPPEASAPSPSAPH